MHLKRNAAKLLLAAALSIGAFHAHAEDRVPPWDPASTGTLPTRGLVVPVFDMREVPQEMPKPVQAIQAQAAPVQAAPDQQAEAERTAEVDESALRYFARQGDTRRLAAEIARLRALYPDWTPPADPLAVPVNVDEKLEAIWALYAAGKYAEARKAIAERQTQESGWEPPADLLERLGVAEARERLINASNLDQYDTVIRVGAANPSLLTCSEVDVLWRVAEAFAKTQRADRARDAYRYVLVNCDNAQERLATMQNVIQLLPGAMADELLALERFADDGTGEFSPVRDDLARKAVAAGGEDEKADVPPEQLARVEKLASEQGKASDSLLLGWYNLRRNNNEAAQKWFSQARGIEDSAEAAQGLALALMARKSFPEAEAVLYSWREENDETRSTYLASVASLLGVEPRIKLEADVLQRMAAAVAAARDAAAAQQFGWYARAFNQFETAGQWFAAALSWDPDNEPAAYGLALTRQRLGKTEKLAELKRAWRGRSERILAVGQEDRRSQAVDRNDTVELAATDVRTTTLAKPVSPVPEARSPQRSAAPENRTVIVQRTARATRGCANMVHPSTLSAQAALARGWCLMEANRPLEAAHAFERALATTDARGRSDAAYGQSLAYLRAGLVDDAAVAAAKAPQARARVAELQSSILAERALGAFESGRYVETLIALDQRAEIAPERIDLMVLRGYAYLRLSQWVHARRVFEAAAGTGNRDALLGLREVEESIGRP